MEGLNRINEILDFAIEREQEAVDFYRRLAEKNENEEIKKIFFEFSFEEIAHKAKLVEIKSNAMFKVSREDVLDLKIADYTVNIEPTYDMTYQDALLLAMQKEKAAFKLYQTLAAKASDENVKAIFFSLAQEEAKHKLRFELEYDDNVLKEN